MESFIVLRSNFTVCLTNKQWNVFLWSTVANIFGFTRIRLHTGFILRFAVTFQILIFYKCWVILKYKLPYTSNSQNNGFLGISPTLRVEYHIPLKRNYTTCEWYLVIGHKVFSESRGFMPLLTFGIYYSMTIWLRLPRRQ